MRPTTESGEGTLTPFHNADRLVERTLTSTALSLRAVHVAQGVTCLVTARSSYRRPRLATAAAIASVAEFVWLSQRAFSRKSDDAVASRLDAAFSLAGLVTLGAATEAADRTSSLNWMMPLAVGSCINALRGVTLGEGLGISAGLAATYAFTTRDALSSHSGRAATAIANMMSFPAFSLVAGFNVRLARRLSSELDAARREAAEQSARAAAEAARNREHRTLHDSALQTLEAIASRSVGIPEEVRDLARREATLLRDAISENPAHRSDLVSGLRELATEFAGRGLQVDLITAEVESEPPPQVTDALCHATRECLTNVLKHAGTSRALVRVVADATESRVTIRDHGSGFDPAAIEGRYGIANSIKGRLTEIGGSATISSRSGRGTRVDLSVPR